MTNSDSASEVQPRLAGLAGEWSGTAKLWFEPDVLASEDVVSGTIVLLHDGRAARHDYRTVVDGSACTGTALLAASNSPSSWQIAWIDTFHTGAAIMFSTGPRGDGDGAGGPIDVLGSYEADGQTWGWRTTFESEGDRLLVRHYNVMPGEDGALAVEFDYRRR